MVSADTKEPVTVDSGDEEEFNVPHSVTDIMSYKKGYSIFSLLYIRRMCMTSLFVMAELIKEKIVY